MMPLVLTFSPEKKGSLEHIVDITVQITVVFREHITRTTPREKKTDKEPVVWT